MRRIRPGEGTRVKAIRLSALADIPEAFGETLEEARTKTAEEYEVRACACARGQDAVFLVAENGQDDWLGMVGGHNEGDRAELVSMWVSPGVRCQGIGQALISTFFEWASATSAQEAYLFVGEKNEAAKALYSSMGFEPTGKTEQLAWSPAVNELEMTAPLRMEPLDRASEW